MTDTREPAGGVRDARAVFVLGAAAGLATPSLVGGLLLPLVDEAPPWTLCLAVVGLVLAAGWSRTATAHVTLSARRLQVWAALTALGGCVAAWALPHWHALLTTLLVDGPSLPGSLVLGTLCLGAALPAALPLGCLLGAAQDGRARTHAATWMGAALGVGLQGWLGEVVLGQAATLQAAAVMAAAATLPLAEGAPLRVSRARLSVSWCATVWVVGTVAALLAHLLPGLADLGSVGPTLIGAGLALGTALGTLRGGRAPSPYVALALLGLPWLLGWAPAVRLGARPDLTLLAACWVLPGLALGWPLGRAFALPSSGRGVPLSLLPALLTLPAPAALLVLLPRVGPAVTTALLAALVVLAAGTRPRPLPLLLPALLGLALALLPRPLADHTQPLDDERQLSVGHVGSVTAPDGQTHWLAVDGRAPLHRSPEQQRRLVQLPLLLQAGMGSGDAPARVLVVAQDLGQAAHAAAEFAPTRLDWLAPVPDPWSEAPQRDGLLLVRGRGSERLHLLREVGLHDAIVLLPDPRLRRRAGLTGTREWFALLTRRLAPGGLFCQWYDLAEIDLTDLKAIIGSAMGTCPQVALLMDHPRARSGVLGIVGSAQTFDVDPEHIAACLGRVPAVAADLEALGLDALMLPALVTQDTGVLAVLTPPERGLSDLRPALGVRGALRALPHPLTEAGSLEFFTARRCDAATWLRLAPKRRPDVKAFTRDLLAGWQHLYGAVQEIVLETDGFPPAFEHEPLGDAPAPEAVAFREALASLPDWAWLTRAVVSGALALERDGRSDEAESALRVAIDKAPASTTLRFELAGLMERRGDPDDACLLYRTVLAFDAEHAGARAALARLCGDEG